MRVTAQNGNLSVALTMIQENESPESSISSSKLHILFEPIWNVVIQQAWILAIKRDNPKGNFKYPKFMVALRITTITMKSHRRNGHLQGSVLELTLTVWLLRWLSLIVEVERIILLWSSNKYLYYLLYDKIQQIHKSYWLLVWAGDRTSRWLQI